MRLMFGKGSIVYLRLTVVIQVVAVLSISCGSTPLTSKETVEPTLPPDLVDMSWLTGEPCNPPCWYGLSVGDTGKEKALDLIDEIPSLQPNQIEEYESQYWDPEDEDVKTSELISIPCMLPRDSICSQLEFVDGLLVRIVLFPNFSVTFDMVVDKIGEPDYVTARPIYPEIGNCEVRLIWIERHLMTTYFETQESSGRDLCRQISIEAQRVPARLPVISVVIESAKILDLLPIDGEDFPWAGFLE